MQSLLQKRIEKLGRLRAIITAFILAYWVGLVAYLPLAPGETVTSASWKCAFVVALALIGLFLKLTPWVSTFCLYTSWLFAFFIGPESRVTESAYSDLLALPFVVLLVLYMVVDARRYRLTRHSSPHLN